MNKKAFGSQLKKARKMRGHTRERLAERCNINTIYLRQIEGGAKVPSMAFFASLCENEYSDFLKLVQLMESAAPEPLKLITALVRSALKVLDQEESKD